MASRICGSRFYVGQKGDPRREATIGGIISLYGTVYGLTVLRPFLAVPDQEAMFIEEKTPVSEEQNEEALWAPMSSYDEAGNSPLCSSDVKLCPFFAFEAYDYQTDQRIGAIPDIPGLGAADPKFWHLKGNWALVRLEDQALLLNEDTTSLHSISKCSVPAGRLHVAVNHRPRRLKSRKLNVIDMPPVGRMYTLSMAGYPVDSGAWIVDMGSMSVFAVVFGWHQGKTYARPAFEAFNELFTRFWEEPSMITMKLPTEQESD
ncbi:uncharacterized protein BO72DRAFT_455470 [Aspergillus fijiensis CBS 313.89]|uniref:Uncharacterized protein n=1 Tax=Aspergillus fijiensis CBS 313.89 TaxID=1448319 RepID=A0A8G1RYY4_9EURO|nr:uncharacterized protein BO72DRAFT_455470 [Aspergillus fijiensis CBS 313.89]RAK81583.1 hypothetical protein BO72DRAFT_455470 [Aspergillus fijiensis CBS 313.89]